MGELVSSLRPILAHWQEEKSVYAARRREAKRLGYSASETGSKAMEVDLVAQFAPYLRTVETGD